SRGHLSNQVVLRVRSPEPELWRGLVYDTFDGTRWTAPDHPEASLGRGFDQSFTVPPPFEGRSSGLDYRHVVSTVYVEQPMPNVVFAPNQPEQVYFPSGTLTTDTYGSLRAPILLDPGVVYSVISEIPAPTPELLRSTERLPVQCEVQQRLRRSLELPDDRPARDVALAKRIAGDAPTRF